MDNLGHRRTRGVGGKAGAAGAASIGRITRRPGSRP